MTGVVARVLDDGSVVLVLPPEGAVHLWRLVLAERPRRRSAGLPWPQVLTELLGALVRSEAEAKGHAVLSAASVRRWLGPSSLDRVTTKRAAVLLGLRGGPRRVQQLVAERRLSSAGRGFVFRGEVEALLAARESRGA